MILRRTVLKAAPLLLLPRVSTLAAGVMSGGNPTGGSSTPRLFTTFTINSTFRFNSQYPTKYNSGDGVYPTWSDDGNTYVIMNDNQGGFQNGSPPPSMGRIGIGRVNGFTSSLSGVNVHDFSALPTSYYLHGIMAIGSTLYLNANDNSGTTHQLLKSTDHGTTWTPTPGSTSTFPAYGWGWIQYGQAYTGNGPHNSNLYAYLYFSATSAPTNGVAVTLGRVLLTNIAAQNVGDWSWYQGGDGMNSANWGAYSSSAAVFTETTANINPFYFPTGQACWLPYFGCYIYTQSHYVGGSSASGWINYYATLAPWGPYVQVASLDMSSFGSLFEASAAAASVAVNGGQTLTLFSSGDYSQAGVGNGPYGLNLINATLS